jgi:hypothetical protein
MRKVYVEVKLKALILMDDDANLNEVMKEMDCVLTPQVPGTEVLDVGITNFELFDNE